MTLLVGVIATGFLTFFAMRFMASVAHPLGLIDHADGVRKLHAGEVPLVGGPALMVALAGAAVVLPAPFDRGWAVLLGTFLLASLIGAYDDRRHVSPQVRLLIQVTVSSLAVWFGGVVLVHLGDLTGDGQRLALHGVAPWFTMIALVGAMNAFNMLDGVDGQCSGVAWVTAAGISVLALLAQAPFPSLGVWLLAAIPVFLLFNLGTGNRAIPKCFLGDSGSMLLGLAIGCLLIEAAHPDTGWTTPIAALWCAAVPLFETLFVMSYRAVNGHSPLHADRNHIHHLLQDSGLSRAGASGVVVSLALGFAAAGIALQQLSASEHSMFLLLVAGFAMYAGGSLLMHRHRTGSGLRTEETLTEHS